MGSTPRTAVPSTHLGFKSPRVIKGKHVVKTPGGGTSPTPPATPAPTSTVISFGADRIIDLDGKAHPAVKAASELPTGVPAYRVRLGGQRTWYIHSPNDIPALIQQTIDLAESKSYTFPPSATPPVSPTPTTGDLWPDDSTGEIVMRRYDGATWVAVTEIGANVRLIAIGSQPATGVAGNSFKREAAGTDYNYAVYAAVVLSNSAYVRCGAVASGRCVIALDNVNTDTAANNQDWRFEVIVSTGAWTLYKGSSSVASGTYGAVPVDTNVELRYLGGVVEAIIGSTKVTSQTAAPGASYFAKVWSYQQGTVRQIAAGYAGVNADPFATIGDNYAVDPNFAKPGLPDYTLTGGLSASSSLPTGAPSATGISSNTTSSCSITAIPNGARFPCTANQLVSIGSYLALVKNSGSATPDLTIQAKFYDSAGALISTSSSYTEAFASASSGWLWRDHVVITPTNTASVECIISFADKSNFVAHFTGFRIGRTQAAADQTMWVEGPAEHTFQYDSNGVAQSGQFPKDFLFKLKTLLGTSLSGVTWTYNVVEGTFNTFTSASGSKAMTGSGAGTLTANSLGSSSATVQINASVAGIVRDTLQVKFSKFLNPPQSGGSGGGSGGSMPISKSSGFNALVGSAFADLTGIMSGTMPGGKTTANIAGELYAFPGGSVEGQSWNNEMKAQRNTGTVQSPIWTDKGAVRASTSSAYLDSEGMFTFRDSSVHTFNENDTGLTGGSIYDWRIVGRINPTGSSNTTLSHTVSGSITVSAP